jgi:hypothetical protein
MNDTLEYLRQVPKKTKLKKYKLQHNNLLCFDLLETLSYHLLMRIDITISFIQHI